MGFLETWDYYKHERSMGILDLWADIRSIWDYQVLGTKYLVFWTARQARTPYGIIITWLYTKANLDLSRHAEHVFKT